MARIGIITYDFFPLIGGIGRHVHLMLSRLKDQDLLFFSPADNSLPRHIRIRYWPIRFFKQVGVSIWLHLNAHRIISEHRLQKLNIQSGAGGVLLTRKVPIPVIVTSHHTYWQQATYIKSQFWKVLFIPFEKRTYRLASRIVAVSEATRDVLVTRYGVPAEKICTVWNAVDTEQFHPVQGRQDCHTIVYIGRIDKRKGIEFLIRSMPLVREQIPDAKLVVGGKGRDLEKMRALVIELKLEQSVTLLGFVPDEQLNELYNRAQCAVVPSIFEGFGITVIEALAAGTRVVGTDVDGIREILKSGEYGRLTPYGNIRALADAIVTELSNPKMAQELRCEYRLDAFREKYLAALCGS
jgi:glycosyltransferase involved in cell wall biosynthesis